MKKFIKKLCILATLSITPLALNSFNKPTFAMESTNSYSNFNEIKQNYEAKLKTINEEIQTAIIMFDNKLNSTNQPLNKSNNSSNNNLNIYSPYLEELKQACFKKARLIDHTIELLSKNVALPSVSALFRTMTDDIVATINTLKKYYEICGCYKPESPTNIIFKCLTRLVDKMRYLLADDMVDCFMSYISSIILEKK